MTFEATVYRVLIASPSDLDEDRKAIADAIHEWNSIFAAEREIMLLPVMWETDAIPETGGRPQGFINERLVKPADIIIGAFWTRVGSPTGVEESGTIEEIKEGLKAGKKVMLYFSENDWPRRLINTDQHQKLEEFRHGADRTPFTGNINPQNASSTSSLVISPGSFTTSSEKIPPMMKRPSMYHSSSGSLIPMTPSRHTTYRC